MEQNSVLFDMFMEHVIPPEESKRVMANGGGRYDGDTMGKILFGEAVEFATEQLTSGDKELGEALLSALEKMKGGAP